MRFSSIGSLRAALAASLICFGCSRGDSAPAVAQDSAAVDPPRPAVIAPVTQPYKVVAVTSPGSLTGSVDFSGPFPLRSTQRRMVRRAENRRPIPSRTVERASEA
jgi:hypothetical protein